MPCEHHFHTSTSATSISATSTGKTEVQDDEDNDSEDKEATDEEEEKEVELVKMVVGMRVKLRDGGESIFATTTILDLEPKPANTFPGSRGDYVLVRGGQVKPSLSKKTAMQVVSGWEKTNLFLKPKGKKQVPYSKYPGILKSDWSLYTEDMSPGDLMKVDQFLIDRQHTWIKPAAAGGQKKK